MADPGFPRGGGANSRGGATTLLSNFPQNCMKLKDFGPGGACPKFYYVDPPLFGGSLESPSWLVDGFLPQNFGRLWGQVYESLFCSKMNTASVVLTCEMVGTLKHYKMVKFFFEICALRGCGDIKTFRLSLAP